MFCWGQSQYASRSYILKQHAMKNWKQVQRDQWTQKMAIKRPKPPSSSFSPTDFNEKNLVMLTFLF